MEEQERRNQLIQRYQRQERLHNDFLRHLRLLTVHYELAAPKSLKLCFPIR